MSITVSSGPSKSNLESDPQAELARLRARVAALESELHARPPPDHDVASSQILREAIEALPDGFALFDQQQRLQYCNRRYREMYNPVSDGWLPGTSKEQIARDSAAGVLKVSPDDVEAFVRERLATNHQGDGKWTEQTLRDGRRFRVSERRLPSGWVVGIRTDVTELQRAELEAVWLTGSLDQSTDAYAVFDADDRLIISNRTWREVHNAPIKDLLVPGTSFEAIMMASLETGSIAEAVGDEENWMRKRIQRHRFPEGPFVLRRGDSTWHQITETPLPDGGIVLVGTDISVLKEHQFALQRSESALLDAIESMSEGFAYWDESDRLVLCNHRFREMFAPIADALVEGADFAALGRLMIERGGLAPAANTIEWMNARIERRADDPPVEFHFADGRWIRCIDALTQTGGRLCFRLDVTEEKRITEDLSRAVQEAQRANQAKTEFLARMSHELRTPLNAILGFAQLLQVGGVGGADTLTARQADFVDQISHAGHHLVKLISEVLDLVKVESGRLQLLLEAVVVEDIVTECRDLIEPMSVERHLSFKTEVAPGLRPVHADALRLKQILLNLLSNAISYNYDGGSVTLRVTQASADTIEFAVIDTGQGIKAADLERLFDPFDRLGESEHKTKGTGIGLSISRRLVEAMGGTIEVTSESGKGSEFRVRLPTDDISVAALRSPGITEVGARTDAAVCHVLYIDKDATDARLMRRIVEMRAGSLMTHAASAKQGLTIVHQSRPDLILLDMNLPDLSSEQAVQAFCNDPGVASIPIIAISTGPDALSHSKLDSRALDHIRKPFVIADIVTTIDQVVSGKSVHE